VYVRLAFSVAAHLEPEVLIVDEVLAVGDASFQKKCLGKMGDVVKEGRTVLFVSHNMDAVATLCTHCVLIDKGRASERLLAEEGVKRYTALANVDDDVPLKNRPRKHAKPRANIFQNLTMHTKSGHRNIVECGGEVTFEIDAENFEDLRDATCGVAIHNDRGHRVVFFHTRYHSGFTFNGAKKARFTCTVPSLPLIPGSYYVELVISDGYGIIEQIERVDRLDVTPANVLGTGMLPKKHQGYFVLPATWTKE
jgi:lipopolysaccharide transport system ATP-binding protein